MKSFVSASWLNLKRAARAAYYGASCAHCVCVCVCLCICVCVCCLRACVCVCCCICAQGKYLHSMEHNKDIKNISYYARRLHRMQACRSCLPLSLPTLSSSLSLCVGHSSLSPTRNLSISQCLLLLLLLLLLLSIPLSYACPSKRNS